MKQPSAAGLNKHQVKTEATLRGLLDAAERVFVRDGYERAQMETIAAEAGRTKGAVYTHFRSKEDIFFALLERKAASRKQEFLRLSEGMNLAQRRATVRKIFLSGIENENWPILMLEFKLFALRHKDSLQRIRELYQMVYEDMSRAVMSEKAFVTVTTKERDMLALAVLRGIPSAVILEKQFNPVLSSTAVLRQVFESIFDALVGAESMDPASSPDDTKKPRRARST